jgi:hypothetical protein
MCFHALKLLSRENFIMSRNIPFIFFSRLFAFRELPSKNSS